MAKLIIMGDIMKRESKLSGLLVGVALLAAISCGGLKVPGSTSTASSDPATAGADSREALKKAFTAQLAAKSYRARFEYSVASIPRHNDLEFVAPDRFHVTVVGPQAQGRSTGQEMILIGKDTYMRVSGVPWQKSAMNPFLGALATTIDELGPQFRDVAQRMTKYEDVKLIGPDVLDGQPVLVYQFKLNVTNGQTSGKIWISTTDGLPRKIEHESSSQTNSDRKMKVSTTYYDYNANINIEPPI
jgi:hypothetical protein